jgi:hypothetical protein
MSNSGYTETTQDSKKKVKLGFFHKIKIFKLFFFFEFLI